MYTILQLLLFLYVFSIWRGACYKTKVARQNRRESLDQSWKDFIQFSFLKGSSCRIFSKLYTGYRQQDPFFVSMTFFPFLDHYFLKHEKKYTYEWSGSELSWSVSGTPTVPSIFSGILESIWTKNTSPRGNGYYQVIEVPGSENYSWIINLDVLITCRPSVCL